MILLIKSIGKSFLKDLLTTNNETYRNSLTLNKQLIFWNKLAQKGYFRSTKVNITIECSLFKLG